MNTHIYEEIRSIEEIVNENTPKKMSEKINTEDEYTKLMNKEEKILDLLDEMKNTTNDESTSYFVSSPIHVIIFKTFKTIMNIANEVSNKNDIFQIIDVVLKRENIIYVGISFVIFAFLLMFITI